MTVPVTRPAPAGRRDRTTAGSIIVGAILIALACLIFANVDVWLAWDDSDGQLGRGRLLLYFTAQANLFTVAALAASGAALLRGRRPSGGVERVRGLATLDMAITGLVAASVLAEPDAPFTFSEFLLHQCAPALMVAWWVILPPVVPMRWTDVLIWLIHPVAWTLCALTYGAESTSHWVPYFFLDPAEVGGWLMVFVFLLVIHVTFVAMGLGGVAVSRRARWRLRAWSRLVPEPA